MSRILDLTVSEESEDERCDDAKQVPRKSSRLRKPTQQHDNRANERLTDADVYKATFDAFRSDGNIAWSTKRFSKQTRNIEVCSKPR